MSDITKQPKKEEPMKTVGLKQTIALIILGAVFLAAPVQAGPLSDFVVNGSGTMETNCLVTLNPGCAVTANGQAQSAQLNVDSFAVQLFTGSPASLNGYPTGTPAGGTQQGLCLPASFLGLLSAAAGDTIQFAHVGTVCEEASVGSAFGYTGTFRITGGTGLFSTASGGGDIAGTFTRDGTAVFVHLHGTIQY